MFLISVSVAVLLVQALPALAGVHEILAALPVGWKAASAPADSTTLSLNIGLQQQNIEQLESRLLAVSTPGNSQYGQHLEMEDVNSLFAPTSVAVSAVQTWLNEAGVQSEVRPTFSGANFPILENLRSNLLLNHCLTQREKMSTPKTSPKRKC